MPKVLAIINTCKECPKRGYYSGGEYECSIVGGRLLKNVARPEWCPLPDHPATIAADALKKADNAKRMLSACLEHAQSDEATVASMRDLLMRANHFLDI